MKFQSVCRFLLIAMLLCPSNVAPMMQCSSPTKYASINGYLCIKSPYVQSYKNLAVVSCGTLCSLHQRCQAFSTVGGPCQLFVFDACSKSVRDCSCSKRGQVFVKQQPGLEPGALCPSGYGDDLCGAKYRMFDTEGSWFHGREKCESERGLVIMSDVIDTTEMNFVVETLYSRYAGGFSFWLGGFQTPGSPEPAGGWYWVACNIAVNGSLWASGEPNNGNNQRENAIGRWSDAFGLTDVFANYTYYKLLCECLSPFD